LILSVAAKASAATRILTLDKAVVIALEKNRDIAKAGEYAKYVQGKYIEERSAALPQLGLNGFYGALRDDGMPKIRGGDVVDLQIKP